MNMAIGKYFSFVITWLGYYISLQILGGKVNQGGPAEEDCVPLSLGVYWYQMRYLKKTI